MNMILERPQCLVWEPFLMGFTFAEWLVKARGKVSKRKLEEHSGVSNAMLTLLEQGKRNPSKETIYKLASALGVDVNDGLSAAGFAQDERQVPREMVLAAGVVFLVDGHKGPMRGTLSEKNLRAVIELLDPVESDAADSRN